MSDVWNNIGILVLVCYVMFCLYFVLIKYLLSRMDMLQVAGAFSIDTYAKIIFLCCYYVVTELYVSVQVRELIIYLLSARLP